MKNVLKYGMMSFALAFGLILVNADTANAQNRRYANREYRQDMREARRDYNRRVRNGDYRKAQREYREDMRDARREYIQNVRRGSNSWYYYQNGRRYNRPFSQWYYRNGYFIRRY
ncbi:MAG TPA: hypothetical protein VHL50_05040 [Pyrinomonadaceae bacterium]|nr:hypothetical protein [Pyrinomonadaceae bacterium]